MISGRRYRATVAIVHNGQIERCLCQGVRLAQEPRLVDPYTVFAATSVSKAGLGGAARRQLVDPALLG
jgi:hypothetical protein